MCIVDSLFVWACDVLRCVACDGCVWFSFVFRRETVLFSRRAAKINSVLCSCFAAQYVFLWPKFFPATPMLYAPQFDSRVVCYPTDQRYALRFGFGF